MCVCVRESVWERETFDEELNLGLLIAKVIVLLEYQQYSYS